MIKFCFLYFIITRFFYIGIILICFESIVGRYDLSGDVLTNTSIPINNIEYKILNFMKNFYSYDSVHFIHIAKDGYTNDKNYAFFPLFPLTIRYIGEFLNFIFNFFHIKIFMFSNPLTKYLISGFLISNLLCFCNTILIYK
jgi:hypothetical protein